MKRSLILLSLLVLFLAACSQQNTVRPQIAAGVDLNSVEVFLMSPAPEKFPVNDREYAESLLALIKKELLRETPLRPVQNPSSYSLEVYIDNYSVNTAGDSFFDDTPEVLGSTVLVKKENDILGTFQAVVQGGGGILQMSERARVKHMAAKLADEIAIAHKNGRYSTSLTKQYAAFEFPALNDQVSVPTLRTHQNTRNVRELPRAQHTDGRTADKPLKSCSIEQVSQMISIGLTNSQIQEACD